MTRSGGTSASTTVCTGLLRTWAASRLQTRTHLLNRFQNGVATDLVQIIGSLIHTLPLGCRARRIHFQDRGSGHIVLVVDGAGFAAVQVASVADEGDQVNHGPQFYRSLTFAARPDVLLR